MLKILLCKVSALFHKEDEEGISLSIKGQTNYHADLYRVTLMLNPDQKQIFLGKFILMLYKVRRVQPQQDRTQKPIGNRNKFMNLTLIIIYKIITVQ